jgi:hypothetical protein
MLTVVLVSLATSAVVAVAYGFVFAQREDRIRLYLSRQGRGFVRGRYVSAFVGAVRGRAAAADTSLLAFLVLLIVFAAGLYFQNLSLQLQSSTETLESILARPAVQAGSAPQATEKLPEASLAECRADFERRKGVLEWAILAGRGIGVSLLAAFFIGILFWHPFIVMRRRFAFELDRFTLRIQGLASKAELAELALAESRVRDEDTLRSFVEVARKIASRHDVPALVATFDLWQARDVTVQV